MNAVILAGGEGRRLRPLSLGCPKPMTPLLGRPVLEHLLCLLKRHGIIDIAITLSFQPQAIMDYFGSGEDFGVRLTYFVEEEPLGTAGSIKHCLTRLNVEDTLVLEGDCLCNLDLSALIQAHYEKGGAATLALYRHPTPLEYGLVVTGEDGRIERFVEKPSWNQIVTDLVNTGIYVLSPRVLEFVPEGAAFDLGRDLFPTLLVENIPLYGYPMEGYWRDIGDCNSYLTACQDALSGQIKLDPGLPQVSPGVWCADSLPQGVILSPPCWIGEEVSIEPGAQIGPCTVLERGTVVEERAVLRRSVLLEGARAGARSNLCGALLCPGAAVREGAVLHEGTVLGEHALVEERAVLLERVRLWPGQTVPAGFRLTHSVTGGSQKGILHFGEDSVIQGVLGEDLGPEGLMALGSVLGTEGRVGLACSPTAEGRMLSRSALAGITAAGGQAEWFPRLTCPVQGAWATRRRNLHTFLFLEVWDKGPAYLHLFDRLGLPLGGERERRIEQALLQGEFHRARAGQVEDPLHLDWGEEEWSREIARQALLGRHALRRVTAAVPGDSPVNQALRAVLIALGCQVESHWRPGIPAFFGSHGGFRLTAQDERGALLNSGQMLALATLIEMENGSGAVAVPPGCSAAVELVAAGYGGTALRLDQNDLQARSLYADRPWLWSAPSAAARICARMSLSSQRLDFLISKTPRFSTWKREVPLSSHRSQVMEALARDHGKALQGDGLRLRTGGGWVYMAPLARRSALRVVAECPDLEVAAELCDFFADQAVRADREAR